MPSIAQGDEEGMGGRLNHVAEVSPTGTIVEAFGQIEAALRSALECDGGEGLELNRPWSVRRLSDMRERGLITAETHEAIEGLSVLRNLAADGGQANLSSQRAREFLALSQGVLYAMNANAKSAGNRNRRPPEQPPGTATGTTPTFSGENANC